MHIVSTRINVSFLLQVALSRKALEFRRCINLVTLERHSFFPNPIFVNDQDLHTIALHHTQR